MHQQLVIPHIKTTLVAAAVTIAALTMMSGSASASTMQQSEHHGSDHATSQNHQEHGQQHQEHALAAQHHQDQKNHEEKQKHEQQVKEQEQQQAAIDLRVGLNNLLAEHVTTNLNVNRSIAGGADEAEVAAGMQSQLANSDALSGAVGSIYGAEAQAQFSEMFNEHIVESNNYAVAVAAGDESAKAEANAELQEYLMELSTFFSTAIPVLPYDAVYGLLLEHENLINASTEAFQAGDYHLSYEVERQALQQVATIADALAAGIVATQPDKF